MSDPKPDLSEACRRTGFADYDPHMDCMRVLPFLCWGAGRTGGAAAVSILLACAAAYGGGGPENVAVVVNARSEASKKIAAEYVRLRRIPECNVVQLDGIVNVERTEIAYLRALILKPILETLRERGLLEQIDYLVYSSDIPYMVDFSVDVGVRKLPKVVTPTASITGLTYLYQFVMACNPDYLRLDINRYMRRVLPLRDEPPLSDAETKLYEQVVAQVSAAKWTEAAEHLRKLLESRPHVPEFRYNLACCLARQGRADDAMQALAGAVMDGWSDAAHMLADTDLEGLRGRDDFRTLIADLKGRKIRLQPTLGFNHQTAWSASGEPVDGEGPRYLLSTMLGVTSGRGNTADEVIAALRRSVEADGARPGGTIYFVKNNNIRSKTRDGLYPAAVAALKEIGVAAEMTIGAMPERKQDVQGVMMGLADFDWKQSGSAIMPGAICEHLTSCGGMLRSFDNQTPLTEFIRHGAAGSCGTVAEPYALAAKFPSPFIHVHYARGCSLAEAFYQSVHGPYQLLIVGDPLCQPWARRPEFDVTAEGVAADGTVRERVTLTPAVRSKDGPGVARFELFVDGRRRGECKPGERLTLEVREMTAGPHELRVVAIAADPIATQNRKILPIVVSR